MAETSPDERDPRLRGRTYAIPFDRVWEAARALASGGLRRWQIIESDDYEGVIRATSTILTRYGSGEAVRGVLGVVGPTRLPYWRAVPMVRFMATLMDVLVVSSGRA